MKAASKTLTDTIIALTAIAAVIYLNTIFADMVKNSPVYRQSRIVSMLVQQENFDIPELLSDTRGTGLVMKFAGALTTAYINFELIPVGEAGTFVAVFESLGDNVDIDGLEYRRKDLAISGGAASKADFEAFMNALRATQRFASVEGSGYESIGGGVRFEILCVSGSP